MEILRKLQDGVDPVAKATYALCFMKYSPVAEDKLLHSGIRPVEEKCALLVL